MKTIIKVSLIFSFYGNARRPSGDSVYTREEQSVSSTPTKTENLSLVVHGPVELPGKLSNRETDTNGMLIQQIQTIQMDTVAQLFTVDKMAQLDISYEKKTVMLVYDASGAVVKLRAIVKYLKPRDHVDIELVQGSDEFCTVQSVAVSPQWKMMGTWVL